MKKHFVYLFLIIISTISCNKNENIEVCENIIDFGEYKLIDDSHNYFPYNENQSKLVFKNSNMELIELKLSRVRGPFLGSAEFTRQCEFDSTKTIKYIYKHEKYFASILSEEYGFELLLNLKANVITTSSLKKEDFLFYDGITTFLRDPLTSVSYPVVFSLLIDKRNSFQVQNNIEFNEEVILNGEIFKNIYTYHDEKIGTVRDYTIHFSKELGIIGILNPKKNLNLSLEKIE